MGVMLWVAFFGAVAYLIHGVLLGVRKLWNSHSGQPVKPIFVSVSPEARKNLRIAGRIALGVTLAFCALTFVALMALSSVEF